MTIAYKRVLLKLSGESLGGAKQYGIDDAVIQHYLDEIKQLMDKGVEVAIVLGGGNIYRGSNHQQTGIEKAQGDYMGMLATIINCMALQAKLESAGIHTRLLTAIKMDRIAEYFVRRRAIRHLEKGRVVILGGGTGNPYFSTDTAAALRAIELNANIILKGTRVDGVYDADPEKHPHAQKIPMLSFKTCIEKDYQVMDMTAFSLCRENNIPIFVFNIHQSGVLNALMAGDHSKGTLVHQSNNAVVER